MSSTVVLWKISTRNNTQTKVVESKVTTSGNGAGVVLPNKSTESRNKY